MADSKLLQIRSLLDKAESTPFPDEAEALTAKATELIAKYRVTEAQLEAARPRQDRGEIDEHPVNLGKGPYVNARADLLYGIARAFGAQALEVTRYDGKIGLIVAHEADFERIEMLYTSLLVQAVNAARAEEIPTGEHGTSYRRAFLFSFAHVVAGRLREANRDAVSAVDSDADTSVALVLVDREKAVSEWVNDKYPRLRSKRAPSAGSSVRGSLAGAAAGSEADIGSRQVGTQRAVSA